MQKLIIDGKKILSGSIKISGSKNSALPILAASILNKHTTIKNIPYVNDILTMLNLLKFIGLKYKLSKKKNSVDVSNLDEKIKIINSLDDDRYIQFAKRICAQEFPDTAPQDYLIHCRNLVVARFNEKGPWPDADKYLGDANKLLDDISSDEDKKLVNASIDQINKNRIN